MKQENGVPNGFGQTIKDKFSRDYFNRNGSLDRLSYFFKSIQLKSSSARFKLFSAKYFKSLSALSFSLLLGYWAYQNSKSEALLNWMKDHPPTAEQTYRLFKSLNFYNIQDLTLAHKVLRYFPNGIPEIVENLPIDELSYFSPPRFWKNNSIILEVYEHKNQSTLARLWAQHLHPSQLKELNLKEWIYLGESWLGLTPLINQPSQDIPSTHKLHFSQNPHWQDPRALVY